MNEDNKLWYAYLIRNLLDAADDLEKAGGQCVQAKDNKLFVNLMELRMKCWDLAQSLVKTPKE